MNYMCCRGSNKWCLFPLPLQIWSGLSLVWKALCQSMTTDCLELTSFIDPSLTWKTISKGRNTSRRSRRSVSKNMKMGQEQEKRSSERSSSLQYSESEKVCRIITFWLFLQFVKHSLFLLLSLHILNTYC